MTIEAEILPQSYVEDLVHAMVRAFRAHQMYLPNNPMYQRAQDGLRDAFPPIFAVLDEVTFLVDETRLIWEDQVVYDHEPKTESFAWGLYKDGMRMLSIRKGAEEGEVAVLLQTIAQARLLPADASDDLLTMLWEREFTRIEYRFAEVVSEPWVYDPQALDLAAQPTSAEETSRAIREEVQAELRPQGMVDLEDFDSTLYFLDEVEITELTRQVEEEYRRDSRGAALTILFDIFELETEPEVREEVLGVMEMLFPNLLVRGGFRAIALILREIRTIRERLKLLDEPARARLRGFEAQLSEPATIGQLLQSLDEATELPPEADLGEVLRELRATALGTILEYLPRLANPEVQRVIGAAAERLASANPEELPRLLASLAPEALPGAIALAGRLSLLSAVPAIGGLTRHTSSEVRLAAVETLGRLGTPGALAALEPALDDRDRSVRSAALSSVVGRLYAGASRRLEAAVTGRGPVELERAEKRQVFEAYALITGPRALDVLRDLVHPGGLFRRKASTETRTCAVYALGKIRSPEARVLVEQVSQDKELAVRHAATSLLREWPG